MQPNSAASLLGGCLFGSADDDDLVRHRHRPRDRADPAGGIRRLGVSICWARSAGESGPGREGAAAHCRAHPARSRSQHGSATLSISGTPDRWGGGRSGRTLTSSPRRVRVLEQWCPSFSGYHLCYPSQNSPAFCDCACFASPRRNSLTAHLKQNGMSSRPLERRVETAV
jgi:hypothetical protein